MRFKKIKTSKNKLSIGIQTKKALWSGLSSKAKMIDTILLELNEVSIPDELSLWQTVTKNASTWKQQFNPKPEDYRKHGYLPNFTIVRFPSKFNASWFTQRIVIQASAPKVLYGTNYFGVDSTDYPTLIQKLADSANLIGLPLTTAQIRQATLRNVTFCYNFYFPNNFPYPIEYLKKMSFLDIGKRYKEVKNTDFLEDTEGYNGKLYNGQVGFGLYDKRAQLLNDARTPEELEVIEKMKRHELPDRVLRMEITYQNQGAVKQHFTTKLGGDKKQTRYLSEAFDEELEKSVLLDVFSELADDVCVKAMDMPILPIEGALKLTSGSKMSIYQAEAWIGRSFITQQIGSLQYKKLQDKYFPRQYRDRNDNKHKQVIQRGVLPSLSLGQIIDECGNQLLDFRVLKPDNLASFFQKPSQLGLIAEPAQDLAYSAT